MTPEMIEQMKKQWEAMGLDPEQMLKMMNSATEMQNNMQEQMQKAMESNPMMQNLMNMSAGQMDGDVLNLFDDSPEVKEDSDLSTEDQKAILCAANLSYYYDHYTNTLETFMPAEDILEGLGGAWGIEDKASFCETVDWLADAGHRVYFDLIWSKLKTLPKAEWRSGIKNLELQALASDSIEEDRIQPYAENILNIYPILLAKGCFATMKHPNVMAWDLSRAINLCRYGFDVEFLTREEAMGRIRNYAQTMYSTYDSWKSMSEGFLVGCGMWSGSTELIDDRYDHHEVLLSHEKSLWQTTAW